MNTKVVFASVSGPKKNKKKKNKETGYLLTTAVCRGKNYPKNYIIGLTPVPPLKEKVMKKMFPSRESFPQSFIASLASMISRTFSPLSS